MGADRLIAACLRGDEPAARDVLAADSTLGVRLTELLSRPMLEAAESGQAAAVDVMLRLGFPIAAHIGEAGGTPLHVAAYCGDVETVRLLLGRGAPVTARDLRWGSMALEWACIGSGENPADVPSPAWVATVEALIESGASLGEVTSSAAQPKPPSAEVAALLRSHGVS